MHISTLPSPRPLIMTRTIMQHWLAIFLVIYGLINVLPFFAPVFMELGWTDTGNAIYTFYSFLCHQMAQRSFFVFGTHIMYSPDQLPVTLTGEGGADMLLLRNFRGNDTLGWKIAWSDRMISLYTGVWLIGIAYWGVARTRTVKTLSIWMFGLLILPIMLDVGTHMISDGLGGVTAGFRYDNVWLATLTGDTLPASFYAGDALGSFNALMRLITGLLAAFGIVWFAFPWLDRSTRKTVQDIDRKLEWIADKQCRRATQLEEAYEHIRRTQGQAEGS